MRDRLGPAFVDGRMQAGKRVRDGREGNKHLFVV
jgi:hypothetical protein